MVRINQEVIVWFVEISHYIFGRGSYLYPSMEQSIVGFFKDEQDDWVAKLQCGHTQHVRHDPPWQLRPWVTSEEGRNSRKGKKLNCLKCDRNEPKDFTITCHE
jgi:hypothetical protein